MNRMRDYRFRIALILTSSFFIVYLLRLFAAIESQYILNQTLFREQFPADLIHIFLSCDNMLVCTGETIFRLISGQYYPIIFNAVIIAGIILAINRKSFPLSMGIVSLEFLFLYIAPGFLQPVLLIFSASFIFFMVSWGLVQIQDSPPIKGIAHLTPIILILLLISFSAFSFTGLNPLSEEYIIDNRRGLDERSLEVSSLDSIRRALPEDSYVITLSYNELSFIPGIRPMPLHGAFSGVVENIIGNGSSAFFYDGRICTIEVYNQTCNEFLRTHELKPVAEYSLGNISYALYSVLGAKDIAPDSERIHRYPPWRGL